MFSFVGNKIGLLWNLDPKKQRFCFDIDKIQLYSTKYMFWFVCHKIVLFLALLNGKRFSSSLQRVFLGFTWFSQNVFVCFRLSYAVFSIMFLTTGFSLSSYVNCTFDLLSYRKHVLVCWQWNWKLRVIRYKKIAIWFFVAKYPFFSLLVPKTCFALLATKLGCFEV